MPNIHISYMAIAVAVVAHFVLGFLWYTPLFGKIWAKEMGMSMDQKPPTGLFVRGLVMNLIGNFFMAYCLAHNIAAWNPLTWGNPEPFMTPPMAAANAALFTWLGFFLPTDMNTVAWEGRSWKFFFINTSYHLISLMVVSFILVYMS